MANQKTIKRTVRRNRIRAKVSGTAVRPRLSVFKSNTALYAQLIDDKKGTTLAAVNSRSLKVKGVKAATEVGTLIGEKAAALKIKEVVFDRGGYIYTGQISALADAARKSGLKF